MTREIHPLPTPEELADWIGPELIGLCRKIADAGGHPWLVGGAVRDRLLGTRSGEGGKVAFRHLFRAFPIPHKKERCTATGLFFRDFDADPGVVEECKIGRAHV